MFVWTRCEKALCPAFSTADNTVCQVLFFSPVPGSHDNHRSKMEMQASAQLLWFSSVVFITDTSTPR